ncbi:MAG TPA: metal ABC transporter permease, partial [Mycobacteriales bacterium]|nr:metal ABC transporter permease [Mycobacteriales bacterium]
MSFLLDPFSSPFMQRALLEAVLLGVIGAVVSVFVVLRRLAFVSDVLTHTVFPGVVIGFLVAGTGGIVWGALAFAGLSAVLLTVLGARARVTEDASMAIVLTAFFALGVILVSRRSSFTTDLTAFLFGRILTVDRTQIVVTAVLGAAVLLALGLLGKELLLRAFDPAGAEARGYRVLVLDLVLNLAVALVVVAAVRAVGTVLVIALLVVPGAAGRLLSDRLAGVTLAAIGIAALAGWLGLVASWQASVSHGLRLASGATVVLVLVALYG